MKLDLILENVRNKYNMGLLEESSLTELDVLKGKIMINESTMIIRKMLVEEGTIEDVKAFLEESWSYALLEESEEEFKKLMDDIKNRRLENVKNGPIMKDQHIEYSKDGIGQIVSNPITSPSSTARYSDEVGQRIIADIKKRKDMQSQVGYSQPARYQDIQSKSLTNGINDLKGFINHLSKNGAVQQATKNFTPKLFKK